MINNIKNYIEDNNYKITIMSGKVYIFNYNKINNISDTYIDIEINKNKVTIYGLSMKIEKLNNKELLIKGVIKRILL